MLKKESLKKFIKKTKCELIKLEKAIFWLKSAFFILAEFMIQQDIVQALPKPKLARLALFPFDPTLHLPEKIFSAY